MKRLLAATIALLVLAGCGAAEESSIERFQGPEREVAQKVEDLQEAGEGRKPEDICANILSRTLVDQLEAAGTTCAEEMGRAIDDADDFALDVRDVTVTGEEATARVQRGDDGPTETFEFVREDGQWRATSFR
ncbi:MAG: hypothetical protein ACRDPC_25835 [Solirubrobacteraceae bacterium]